MGATNRKNTGLLRPFDPTEPTCHTDMVNKILVRISRIPGGMFWKNNTGALQNETGRLVTYGLPGSPDILGLLCGRAIGIEAKYGSDTLRRKQALFRENYERCGGTYILARDVDVAVAEVERCMRMWKDLPC